MGRGIETSRRFAGGPGRAGGIRLGTRYSVHLSEAGPPGPRQSPVAKTFSSSHGVPGSLLPSAIRFGAGTVR